MDYNELVLSQLMQAHTRDCRRCDSGQIYSIQRMAPDLTCFMARGGGSGRRWLGGGGGGHISFLKPVFKTKSSSDSM